MPAANGTAQSEKVANRLTPPAEISTIKPTTMSEPSQVGICQAPSNTWVIEFDWVPGMKIPKARVMTTA